MLRYRNFNGQELKSEMRDGESVALSVGPVMTGA